MTAKTNNLDALRFSSHEGLNAKLIDWRYEELSRYFRGRSCLELGAADGRSLAVLLERFDEVVAVDGSAKLLDELRRTISSPKLTTVASMFEDLALERRFDTVMLGHILEHVDDPQRVIAVARRHLAPGGVLVADVPNAHSIHRHVGVKLGLLGKVTDLNEADVRIGHQRVYTPDRFRTEFDNAGLRVVAEGGFFMKPLSNAQMEQLLTPEQLRAFFDVGREFPKLAAEIYIVAEEPA
jgi:2-polyprenyl-3-methyl-5-hydroxy-6-metoxy-1,4-benzoquinol methylase